MNCTFRHSKFSNIILRRQFHLNFSFWFIFDTLLKHLEAKRWETNSQELEEAEREVAIRIRTKRRRDTNPQSRPELERRGNKRRWNILSVFNKVLWFSSWNADYFESLVVDILIYGSYYWPIGMEVSDQTKILFCERTLSFNNLKYPAQFKALLSHLQGTPTLSLNGTKGKCNLLMHLEVKLTQMESLYSEHGVQLDSYRTLVVTLPVGLKRLNCPQLLSSLSSMKITFSSNCNLFCIKRLKWKLFIIRAQTPPPSFLRWPPTRNADWDSWSWTVSRTTCSWRKSSSGTRSASSPRRKRMRKRGRRLMISEVKSCLIVQRLSGKSDNIVESILRRNPGGTIIFLVFLKLFHILGQRFSFLSCYTLVLLRTDKHETVLSLF